MNDRIGVRARLKIIIFGVDTPAGRMFDVALLYAILVSVLGVMLESVKHLRDEYGPVLDGIEWVFTILFTIEYVARIWVVDRPVRYMLSFYGIIDFLSIVPSYLGLFFIGSAPLQVIRTLRLLRIFRILKLSRYISGTNELVTALKACRAKISVFLFFVVTITVIMGTLMYIVEDPDAGFTSIPKSIYWAIVTLTTVGYGDISPQTGIGQFLSSVLMLTGYAIIAVPTGIVSAEMVRQKDGDPAPKRACQSCGEPGHDREARYCKSCGGEL